MELNQGGQSAIRKLSIAHSIHARFALCLAISTAVDGWQGMVPFLMLYFADFAAARSEQANEITIM